MHKCNPFQALLMFTSQPGQLLQTDDVPAAMFEWGTLQVSLAVAREGG
jgi:hypothetical protein